MRKMVLIVQGVRKIITRKSGRRKESFFFFFKFFRVSILIFTKLKMMLRCVERKSTVEI